jgi:hypothetical protein
MQSAIHDNSKPAITIFFILKDSFYSQTLRWAFAAAAGHTAALFGNNDKGVLKRERSGFYVVSIKREALKADQVR